MSTSDLILRGVKTLMRLIIENIPLVDTQRAFADHMRTVGTRWRDTDPLPDQLEYGDMINILRYLGRRNKIRKSVHFTFHWMTSLSRCLFVCLVAVASEVQPGYSEVDCPPLGSGRIKKKLPAQGSNLPPPGSRNNRNSRALYRLS